MALSDAASATGALTPPVSDRDHIRGSADAPVTLVEYADFECPFCGDAYHVVRELERRYGQSLRFVFRHFPVPSIHPYAQLAAEASEAAAAQGRFWEMHDHLFEHQPSLAVPDLVRYATDLDLDVDRFEADLRGRACLDRVRSDVVSGQQSGVAGTPTFFLDSRHYEDSWDLKSLSAAIDAGQ